MLISFILYFMFSFPVHLFGSSSLVLKDVGIVPILRLMDVGFRGWRFWVWVTVIGLSMV
jgi:hypothetical protein